MEAPAATAAAVPLHRSDPATTSAVVEVASKGNDEGLAAASCGAPQPATPTRAIASLTTTATKSRNNTVVTNGRWRMVILLVLSLSFFRGEVFNRLLKRGGVVVLVTNTNTATIKNATATTPTRTTDAALNNSTTLGSTPAIMPQQESSSLSTSVKMMTPSRITATTPSSPERLPLPERVHLLRIPKAGSSSFSSFLRLQYGCTSERWPPGDCTGRNARACPMIRGCTDHVKPPPPPPAGPIIPMVTVFREPVARYVSAYSYPGHHGRGTGKNISLHAVLFPEYDNTVVNYLSGNAIGTWDIPDDGNAPRNHPPNATTLPTVADYRARLRKAVAVTRNRLSFCGLLEYWSDTLTLFCRMYACPIKVDESLASKRERIGGRNRRRGKNSRYPYDDPYTMRVLQKSNMYDSTLYRAAQERFCCDLQRYCQSDDTNFTATLSRGVLMFCQRVMSKQRRQR